MRKLYFYILLFLFSALSLSLYADRYQLWDLGTLSDTASYAGQINNHNLVTGLVKNEKGLVHFIWHPIEGLTCLPLAVTKQPPLINNHNDIVGVYWYRTDYWFMDNKTSKRLYIKRTNHSLTDIGFPSSWAKQEFVDWQDLNFWDDDKLYLVDFNDQGQLLLADALVSNKRTKVTVWQEGIYYDLDSAVLCRGYALNNQGVILGRRWHYEGNKGVPMLGLYDLKQGTFSPITKDLNMCLYRLNDNGQVTVARKTDSSDELEGMLWEANKGWISLGSFLPTALNNKNQMIGFVQENNRSIPYLWDQGTLVNLEADLELKNLDMAWIKISELKGINDLGYIIGDGLYDSQTHAFILVPCRDPQ